MKRAAPHIIQRWQGERAAYERLLERLESKATQFRGNESGPMPDTTFVNKEGVKRRMAELDELLTQAGVRSSP